VVQVSEAAAAAEQVSQDVAKPGQDRKKSGAARRLPQVLAQNANLRSELWKLRTRLSEAENERDHWREAVIAVEEKAQRATSKAIADKAAQANGAENEELAKRAAFRTFIQDVARKTGTTVRHPDFDMVVNAALPLLPVDLLPQIPCIGELSAEVLYRFCADPKSCNSQLPRVPVIRILMHLVYIWSAITKELEETRETQRFLNAANRR
jgi:hypothetical protein